MTLEIEWILVDDGSTDQTHEMFERFSNSQSRCRIIRIPEKSGLGNALWHGFQQSTFPLVSWLPGDGQVDASCLMRAIVDSPYSSIPILVREETSRELSRRMISWVFFYLGRVLTSFPALGSSGIFVAPAEKIKTIPLFSKTSLQTTATVVSLIRLGHSVSAFPVSIAPRKFGRSKILTVMEVARTLRDLLSLRGKLSRVGF